MNLLFLGYVQAIFIYLHIDKTGFDFNQLSHSNRSPNVSKSGCHSSFFWSSSHRYQFNHSLTLYHFLSSTCLMSLCTLGITIHCLLQYLPHLIKPGKNIFDRFAVLITVSIVWIYAHILTVGGAYNGASVNTQNSCRTDRSGLLDAAPW